MRHTYQHLLLLSDELSAHTGLAHATISNRAVGRATLFKRLRDRKGCTVDTAIQAFDWFSDNWPSDLDWPEGIPRPERSKKDAA